MTEYSVATIGFFDGVHLGHQKLISTVKNLANKTKFNSLLFTFDATLKSQNLIYSFDNKIKVLNSFKLGKIIILNFKKVKNLSSQEFFEKYIVKNRVKMLVVGEDFKFGKGASAGIEELVYLTHKYEISLIVIKDVEISLNKKVYSISSTLIRKKILESSFEEVNRLLGRDYFIEGRITKGLGLATRLLGVPTINVIPEENLILPRGVILGITEIRNLKYPSIANFGYSPTFDKGYFLIEVHILNRNINIKKGILKFYPLKKIRNEKYFSSVSLLKSRILNDIKLANKFFQ